MANSKPILDKLARNLDMLQIPYSRSGINVVVDNGSNDLTLSYVEASIQSPMGGVSPANAPYLGIGVGNPGQILIKSSSSTNDDITDVLDSALAARVLCVCAALANDLSLENSDASFSARIRGHVDLLGMGQ